MEAAEAMLLIDEATEVGRRLGDRQSEASARAFRGHIAARDGRWRVALESFIAAAPDHAVLEQTSMTLGVFWGSAFALCRLGNPQTAAVVLGFVQANAPGMVPDMIGRAMLDETEELLLAALGADETARLKARGASLTTRATIELVQDAAAALDVT
jgi:hypothetical protein